MALSDTPPPVFGRWRQAVWPPWIDRNVALVIAARFAMSAAQALAGVITALYLTADGFSPTELATLVVTVTAVSALLTTAIGLWSDRFGRKPFLVAMPLLTAAAAASYGFVRPVALLFVCAALGSFGRGAGAGGGANIGPYLPAESAFVAERVGGTARASAFGRMAFFSALGALAGSPLAGLAKTSRHLAPSASTAVYRPAFLAVAVLAAIAGLLALGLQERRAPRGEGVRRARLRWPRRSWPVLWRFCIANSVNGAAFGMVGPFVSYWLYRRYGASPGAVGDLFSIINAGALVVTLCAASIGRRLGTVRAIVTARCLSGMLLLPMVLAPAFWIAGALFLVRTLVQRVGLPLSQSFVQDMADPSERAGVSAFSRLPAQASQVGSQELAGYLFAQVSLAAPFELAAIVQSLGAFLFGILFGGLAATSARSRERSGSRAT